MSFSLFILSTQLDFASISFIVISVFAFAWMVRLSLTIHRRMREHTKKLHDRLDEIEDIARDLKKDVHFLSIDLNDKADVSYIERRLDGLLDLIKQQEKSTRK